MAGDRPAQDEITEEMIEAGADVLLGELGGAVSVFWSAPDLAKRVYRAMRAQSRPSPLPVLSQSESKLGPHLGTTETRFSEEEIFAGANRIDAALEAGSCEVHDEWPHDVEPTPFGPLID
jgi:hypothetical protein